MSQTAQWGCHQPLPTDWASLPQPSLQCFSAATHTDPLLPRLGWEQPAAGPCGSLKPPKPPSSSSLTWCSVPWSWAWLAGGLPSGLPVRNNYRFGFTGGSMVWTSAPCPPPRQGESGQTSSDVVLGSESRGAGGTAFPGTSPPGLNFKTNISSIFCVGRKHL